MNDKIPAWYQHASYLTSAAKLNQLPPDEGIEVAFAGRSNAGKSTALNAITGQKRLAHTSKQPGRTQMINFFEIDDERRLIDLPGYGYAKVPLSTKQRWDEVLSGYLQQRECLRGLVLLMDIRHPLKPFDQHMLTWAAEASLPVHILLNKADKLKRGAAKNMLLAVQKQLRQMSLEPSIQCFSAVTKEGREELFTILDEWYGFSSDA